MYEHESGESSGGARRSRRLPGPERSGQAIDTYRLLGVLKKGKRLLLVTAVAGLVLGYVIPKFVMQRTWLSRAVLVYEGIVVKDNNGEESVNADPRDLRTMVDSVKIPANLKKVQTRMGMSGPLDLFAKRIDVTYDLESNLVEIQGSGESADDAVELSNTMTEVFLEHRKAVDQEELRTGVETIEKNLRSAQDMAKETRDRYDAFRKQEGISDLTAERQQSIKSTADLQAKADLASARAKELEYRLKAAEGSATTRDPQPSVPVVPVTAAEREELEKAKAELSTALARYTPEHPIVQGLQARVQSLQAHITSGTTGARGASRLRAERDAAAAEEHALRSQLEALRGSLSKFSSAEGEATNLLAAVEVAEARVKSLRQELGRAEAKARVPGTGFRVESAASRPDNPEKSTVRVATAFAIPVVMFLAVFGWMLWKELGDLKVCTPAEVAYWGKGPVIGSTTWPRDNDALNDLLAEMDDYMVDASGKTLVVPATERELDLVKAIADRFSQEEWRPDQVFVTSVEVLPPPITVSDGQPVVTPSTSTSTALAPKMASALSRETEEAFSLTAEPWTGPDGGPALRRASRRADRVLVIVRASETTAPELSQVPGRLGREDGIGYLVVGIKDEFTKLPDRAGSVAAFWRTFRDRSST